MEYVYRNNSRHDKEVADQIVREINAGKNVYLFGPVGCGKTFLASYLFKYFFDEHSFKVINLADADHCEWLTDSECFDVFMKYRALSLDDVGVEKDVNEYGIKSNPFTEFINRYYNRVLRGEYRPLLFATSNLNPTQCFEKYGPRVFSRLKQLFTFAQFTGEDKRKLKIIGG